MRGHAARSSGQSAIFLRKRAIPFTLRIVSHLPSGICLPPILWIVSRFSLGKAPSKALTYFFVLVANRIIPPSSCRSSS